jgi:hypothetical protein
VGSKVEVKDIATVNLTDHVKWLQGFVTKANGNDTYDVCCFDAIGKTSRMNGIGTNFMRPVAASAHQPRSPQKVARSPNKSPRKVHVHIVPQPESPRKKQSQSMEYHLHKLNPGLEADLRHDLSPSVEKCFVSPSSLAVTAKHPGPFTRKPSQPRPHQQTATPTIDWSVAATGGVVTMEVSTPADRQPEWNGIPWY